MIRRFRFEAESYESLNCLRRPHAHSSMPSDRTPSDSMGAARARREVDDLRVVQPRNQALSETR